MAITGYEIDFIRKTDNGDVPVPIYDQYNHHYIFYVYNSDAVELQHEKLRSHSHKGHQFVRKPGASNSSFPSTTLFSEGNGGESRLSFHGYAPDVAQLVESPTEFTTEPMMINTKSPTGVRGGPLPNSNNIWPPNPPVSPLNECPCTTRISKVPSPPITSVSGVCPKAIDSADDCFAAAAGLGFKASSNSTGDFDSLPLGCSVAQSDGDVKVCFNTDEDTLVGCGAGPDSNSSGITMSINTLALDLYGSLSLARITVSGKDGVWFGVGFNATVMADQPYAIIVDGYGAVTERKLAEHDPGVQLENSLTVISNAVLAGIRTVVVERPLQGKDSDYYTFSMDVGSINSINFINRTGAVINLKVSGGTTCVCAGQGGSIEGAIYNEGCNPEPLSDLLQQNNTACFFETFNGGLQCCYDGMYLLDEDQEIPPYVDTYYMKWRVYFTEYTPQKTVPLFRLYWTTENMQGEYDIPQCAPGTPVQECVHTITSRFSLRDVMSDCDPIDDPWCADSKQVTDKGVALLYAGPHCHAPMCLEMELYDETTGNLICGSKPVFGTSDAVYDELGYIQQIPPCLWGTAAEGLQSPPILQLDTPLLAIKRANSTNKHYGDMASWQMRGAYAQDLTF
jgi:hypothetical protein